MKPKYHKNTITGEWADISRPKNRSAFGEFITGSIISDADILLNRHYTRDVDLFRMADAIMTTASATMAVQYFIAQAAPVADYYGTKYNVWKQGLNQGNQGINVDLQLFADDELTGKGMVKVPTVKYGGKNVNVYRGGNDFTIKPGEIKVDKVTGIVKDTHGVSLNVNPSAVSKYGGAYKIDSLPDGLKIIQQGKNAEHYVIVPSRSMRVDEFQGLLNQIKASPIGK